MCTCVRAFLSTTPQVWPCTVAASLLAVALRVVALPSPEVLSHVVQVFGCLESEFLLGQSRVSGQVRNVTGPPADDRVGELVSGNLFHSIDHVEYGHTDTLSEVVGAVLALGLCLALGKDVVPVEGLNSVEVASGEVLNVDVVANAGSVRGGVVVTEDLEATLAVLADGHLSEEGEKVSGLATRVLTDLSRFVGTGGVEVSQTDGAELGVGIANIANDDLAHPLGAAVDRLGCKAGRLGDGHLGRRTVDGSRGRVDESVASVVMHHLEQVDETSDVDMVVVDGDFGALADGFKGSTEDDTPNLVLARVGFKDIANVVLAAKVALEDVDLAVVLVLLGGALGELVDGDLLETLDGGGEGVVVVVEDCAKVTVERTSQPWSPSSLLSGCEFCYLPVTRYLRVKRVTRATCEPM